MMVYGFTRSSLQRQDAVGCSLTLLPPEAVLSQVSKVPDERKILIPRW